MRLLRLFLPLLLITIIVSCKKTSVKPAPKAGTDVYISGIIVAKNGNEVACYWKNGTLVRLGDSSVNSSASAIALNGTDIYVTGVELDANYNSTAVCWKNGIKIPLASSVNSTAYSIATSGGNVYITGNITQSSSPNALYWLNGTPYGTVPSGFGPEFITVSGSDVYIAGSAASVDGTTAVAGYLKNNTLVRLDDSLSHAWGIASTGSDVYVIGDIFSVVTKNENPVYWKNGTAIPFTPYGAYANAAIASNNDVYFAGLTLLPDGHTIVAAYWKNGAVNAISNLESNASSIAVSGNNIYLAGKQYYSSTNSTMAPVYWKDNVVTYLTKSGAGNATGIVVVPH